MSSAVATAIHTRAPVSSAPEVDDDPSSAAVDADRPRPRARSGRTIHARIAHEEFFDYQPTSTADLPDPRPLVENLTRCVIEILAGARDLEQIARWVTDDVYSTLLKRQVISARARAARGRPVIRPAFALGSTIVCEPRDGIIEAVVVVNSRARSRAVAIRLEGLDRRWRASAIHVL